MDLQAAYDVVVVGGGAGGLSAGVVLGRSRRSVLVIDAGEQRNLPAAGVHGFLTRDGIAPGELAEVGADEVRAYGGEVVAARVTGVTGGVDRFEVTLADGREVAARRIVLATGLIDVLPEVPGLRERWGRDVVHCPYCHGWEVRDRRIGVLASGPMAMHQVLLFGQLTDDLVLLLDDAFEPDEAAREQLAATGVEVVRGAVAEVLTRDDAMVGVRLGDGTVVDLDVMAVAPRFEARGDLATGLGIAPVEHPTGFGTQLPHDPMTFATPVPGVYAVGNAVDPMAQVVIAAGAGLRAGAVINADLAAAEVAAAVEQSRSGAAFPA